MERLARTNSSFLTSGVTSEIISMDPSKPEEPQGIQTNDFDLVMNQSPLLLVCF